MHSDAPSFFVYYDDMPDASSGSGNQDRKKLFDELSRKRREMIDAEKQKQEQREEGKKAQEKMEGQAFLEEAAQTRERSAEREDWRQEQHAKRREDAELRRKKEEQKKLEEAEQKKKDAARQRQQEMMDNLHRTAVEQRIVSKIEGAKMEEEKIKKAATHREEHVVAGLDTDLERAIENIDHEMRLKADRLKAEISRRRKELMEESRRAKKSKSPEEEGPESARKREILALDERLTQGLFDIKTEAKSLKQEVRNASNQRKARTQKEANMKRAEAEMRRKRVEEWFHRGEDEAKE